MIFDPTTCCACAAVQELQGEAPLTYPPSIILHIGSKSKDALKQIAGWNILSENIESGEMESKYFPVLLQSRILGASVLFVL